MNTKNYLREIDHIICQIEKEYFHLFQNIEKPFFLIIKLPGGDEVHFEISNGGIKPHSHLNDKDLNNKEMKIIISYQNLKRLLDKPTRILRYIFEGKIKVLGDHKLLLETLKKLI